VRAKRRPHAGLTCLRAGSGHLNRMKNAAIRRHMGTVMVTAFGSDLAYRRESRQTRGDMELLSAGVL